MSTIIRNFRINKYDGNTVNVMTFFLRSEPPGLVISIGYGRVIPARKTAGKPPPSKNRFYDLEELFTRLIDMEELLAFEVRERFYEIGSPQGMKEFERYIAGRKN